MKVALGWDADVCHATSRSFGIDHSLIGHCRVVGRFAAPVVDVCPPHVTNPGLTVLEAFRFICSSREISKTFARVCWAL